MNSKAWVAVVLVGTSLLAGVLLTVSDGSAQVTGAARGAMALSSTATGTATVTVTPSSTTTPAATATATVTLTPIASVTAHAYLPYVSRWGPPTPTPTPTATPTPVPIQFTGTSDQDEEVRLVVKGDLSAVIELRVPVTVVCGGGSAWFGGDVFLPPDGLSIRDRQFSIRLWAGRTEEGAPAYHEYAGQFDLGFSSAQGTWRRWLIVDNQPVCSVTGTWSASRGPK